MKKRKIYNGGSMTNFMGRDFQLYVGDKLEGMGLEPYTPSKNKSINDKEALGNKDIAKMIVAKDSEAIINSDIRLFNNLQTTGTSIEIGQVLGMNDFANIIKQLIEKREKEMKNTDMELEDYFQGVIDEIWLICASELKKDFVLFDVDVRSHDEPESGYRRSTGYHQYQRGVGMRLMRNENGYLKFHEEALPKLEELSSQFFSDAFEVEFDENDELVLTKGFNEKCAEEIQ